MSHLSPLCSGLWQPGLHRELREGTRDAGASEGGMWSSAEMCWHRRDNVRLWAGIPGILREPLGMGSLSWGLLSPELHFWVGSAILPFTKFRAELLQHLACKLQSKIPDGDAEFFNHIRSHVFLQCCHCQIGGRMMFEELTSCYIKDFHFPATVIITEALEEHKLEYHLDYRSADTWSWLIVLGWI